MTTILRGILSLFSSKIIIYAIGLITTPLLARLLGPSKFGVYSYILSVVGLTMLFVNFGMFSSIRKYISEERGVDNWRSIVFSTYTKASTFLLLLFVVVLFISYWVGLLKNSIFSRNLLFILLFIALVLAKQTSKLTRGALMGINKEHISESLRTINKTLFAGLSIYFIIRGEGVTGVLLAVIFGFGFESIGGLFYLSKYIDFSYLIVGPTMKESKLISFSGSVFFTSLFTKSLHHIDIILLNYFLLSSNVGIYKSALIIIEIIWFLPAALEAVFLHNVSSMESKQENNRIDRLNKISTKYNIIFILLIASGIFVLAEPFIILYYGHKYLPAVTPLTILLPGAFGFAIAKPLVSFSLGQGYHRMVAVANGVSAFLNGGLNLLLIPRIGIEGAALGSSIGYGSMAIFHILVLRHIGTDPIQDISLGRVFLAGGANIAVMKVFRLYLSNTQSLLVIPIIGLVFYTFLLYNMNVLRFGEIRGAVR